MKRGKVAHPDYIAQTPDGEEIEAVSVEALMALAAQGVNMLDVAGGVLSIVVGRRPTGFPAEAVTTIAIMEWKERPVAKDQPEQQAAAQPAPPAAEDPTPDELEEQLAAEEDFDESTLPEEDVSELPESLRS